MTGAGRVVVIGGGVSGLTTAYRLAAAGVDVSVREASDRPGGKLGTVRVGDLRLETGADSFVARKPWAVNLCRELGLAGELVSPGAKGAYLWTDRGLVAFLKDAPFGIPGDIGDVMRSSDGTGGQYQYDLSTKRSQLGGHDLPAGTYHLWVTGAGLPQVDATIDLR